MAKRKQKSIYLMPEPKWQEIHECKTDEERTSMYRKFEYFVHYEVPDKKQDITIRKWLESDSGLDKDLLKKLKKVPDVWFRSFAKHTYIWTKTKGYMNPDIRQHLLNKIPALENKAEEIIEEKQKKEAEKPKVTLSIQQRMMQQLYDLCGEWEDKLDQHIDAGKIDVKSFDFEKDMKVYRAGIIKPAHAKLIKETYTPNLEEAKESLAGECEQLREAYSFMNKKMKQDYVAFYEKIMNACDALILTGKANRKTRQPRARSKETIVKKVKFQVNDSALGIASISTVDIVYANELWVYNTKTRKVGVYHALNKDPKALGRPGAGLMVKGTTIQDFDPETSLQKTLRKPAEQIKNWTGNAKTKFAKAFDEVKAVETKLNGRLNDTTILLKAF